MILVDTSIWITYLAGDRGRKSNLFQETLDRGVPFALTSVIAQEILQGVRTDADHVRLEGYLVTQRLVEPRHPWTSYVEAARIYARCRRRGVTIRSTIDCLIARVAIEHDLELLHDDRDYDLMATVIDDLKIYGG